MKKIIKVTILLFFIIMYFFKSNNSNSNEDLEITVSTSIKVDTLIADNKREEVIHSNNLEGGSNNRKHILYELKKVHIDRDVFAAQILPLIKKFHQKLFDEDYGKRTVEFKPGDKIEIYSNGEYIHVNASSEYINRIVEDYTDSTCTVDFKYIEEGFREGVFFEERGHSVSIPLSSYVNCYNNNSLIEDDFDYDGNDDLLVTTYWYFGGAHGSQTKFLFLKKGGEYILAYSDDIFYESSCFMGNSSEDGYDYSKNGILYGSVSEYGEGSAGCCPSHFYDTETKFIDGELKIIKKTLTKYLVKGKDGVWDYVDVKMGN